MYTENKTDNEIIKFILNLLNIKYEHHKYFTDGAFSHVILLNDKYLIKRSNPIAIKSEIQFLLLNPSPKMQKVIYYDPCYRFAVYEFIDGNIMKKVTDINDFLTNIANITKNYKHFEHYGYGYLYEEVETWSQFLKDEVNHSSENLTKYIPDNSIVMNQIEILNNYPFEKKLIHGDFGTHNFLEVNGKFAGVIDPMPVVGDALYDLLFAIVSNASVVPNITLDKIYSITSKPLKKVKAMLIIVLYCRISRCLKHHKQDIDIYMAFWNKLTHKI